MKNLLALFGAALLLVCTSCAGGPSQSAARGLEPI